MKTLLLSLLSCALAGSAFSQASLSIWNPQEGTVVGTSPYQSYAVIACDWTYSLNPNPPWTGQWQCTYSVDGGGATAHEPPVTLNFGIGPHSFRANLLQYNGQSGQYQLVAYQVVQFEVIQTRGVTGKNNYPGLDIVFNGTTHHDVPAEGVTRWLGVGGTGYVEAVDGQEEAGYDHFHWYWASSRWDEWKIYELRRDFGVQVDVTYTGYYNREYEVEITAAYFLEPGSGAEYVVNGTNVGTSWEGLYLQNLSQPLVVQVLPPAGWMFLQWDDGSSDNPRVFIPTDHLSRHAVLKKHLGSLLSTATSTNSQRKYAADNYELYGGTNIRAGICYESAGEIWLSDSPDGGFLPEFRVSAGTGGFASPSLLVANGEASPLRESGQEEDGPVQGPTLPQLALVYQRVNGSNKEVWFRENRANSWRSPVLLSAGSTTDKFPVIARRGVEDWEYSRMAAVWQHSNGLTYSRATSTTSGWTWTTPALVTGTSSARFNPSLANAPHDTDSLFLTSDNGSDVFLQRLAPYAGGWRAAAIAVPASVAPISYGSQVHADYQNPATPKVHVVWEVQYDNNPPTCIEPGKEKVEFTQHKVMYQRREGSNWTAAQEFAYGGSTAIRRPSVASTADGTIIVTWDDGVNTYRSTSSGSTWSVAQMSQSGRYSNLVGVGPHGGLSSARYVNMGNSGAPYPVQLSEEEFMGTGGIEIPTRYSRRIVLARTASEGETSPAVSLELGTITVKRVGGQIDTIDLVPMSDTMPDLDEKTLLGFLRTSTVAGIETAESVFVDAILTVQNSGGIRTGALRLGLDLLNAQDDGVVRGVGNEIAVSSDTTVALRMAGQIANAGVQAMRLRPRIGGLRTTIRDLVYSVVHVHTLQPAGSANKKAVPAPAENEEAGVPAIFALHQNFPNPFNPSTGIRFDLPEPATVSLAIYDLLGRNVADLAAGEYEAGYHSATWNATGAASGVYLARFTAMSATGNVVHTKTLKLVLMR